MRSPRTFTFREMYTGQPVDGILDQVTERVVAAGVNTMSEDMQGYAGAFPRGG